MRSTAKYLHSLADFRAIDRANAELASASTLIAIAEIERARVARRERQLARDIASGSVWSDDEIAWFKRPIGGSL